MNTPDLADMAADLSELHSTIIEIGTIVVRTPAMQAVLDRAEHRVRLLHHGLACLRVDLRDLEDGAAHHCHAADRVVAAVRGEAE